MQINHSQTGRSPVIAAALVYLHSASLDRLRARQPFWERKTITFWPNSNSFFYYWTMLGSSLVSHGEIGCPSWDYLPTRIRWWWKHLKPLLDLNFSNICPISFLLTEDYNVITSLLFTIAMHSWFRERGFQRPSGSDQHLRLVRTERVLHANGR